MKTIPFPNQLRRYYQQLFYLEQWAALLVGIVCLGVAAWAGFLGFHGSATVNQSGLWPNALATMKCSLTVAVALIGTALVRFAFYKPGRKKPAPTSERSTLAQPIAFHKGRG